MHPPCAFNLITYTMYRMKLQSFFFDQTGGPPEAGKLRRPAAALNTETRHLPFLQ
jgi:hypothetical protein